MGDYMSDEELRGWLSDGPGGVHINRKVLNRIICAALDARAMAANEWRWWQSYRAAIDRMDAAIAAESPQTPKPAPPDGL
ncbi:MAG: hypothetical protein ACEQSU_14050 [Microgenomates group bacterium]